MHTMAKGEISKQWELFKEKVRAEKVSAAKAAHIIRSIKLELGVML